MASDDKLIAAVLAAAILQRETNDSAGTPSAERIVKLYFQCLEAIHAERLRRYAQPQSHL